MQASNRRRALLYPTALVVLGALVWVGWIHEPEPDLGALLSSAEFMAKAGALDPAEETCRRVLERDAENVMAWLILGYVQAEREDLEASLESHEMALRFCEADDVRHDTETYMADLERRLGRADEARLRLDRLEKASGDTARIERERALLAWDRGDLDAAREHVVSARELSPDDGAVRALLGRLLIAAGRLEAAATALEDAGDRFPEVAAVWEELARRFVACERPARAAHALERVLRMDSGARNRLLRDPYWSRLANEAEFSALLN